MFKRGYVDRDKVSALLLKRIKYALQHFRILRVRRFPPDTSTSVEVGRGEVWCTVRVDQVSAVLSAVSFY